MKKNYPTISSMPVRKNFINLLLTFAFLITGFNVSKACSPLSMQSLTSQSVTATYLILDWTSNTIYTGCQYYIEVELVCNNGSFSGAGPFLQSATMTKTAGIQAYATQSINIASLC